MRAITVPWILEKVTAEMDEHGRIEIYRGYLNPERTCWIERKRQLRKKTLFDYELHMPEGTAKVKTLSEAFDRFYKRHRKVQFPEGWTPSDKIDSLFAILRMNLEGEGVRMAMGPENHNRACEALNHLAREYAGHFELLVP